MTPAKNRLEPLLDHLDELAALVNSAKDSTQELDDSSDKEDGDTTYDGEYLFDTPVHEVETLIIQIVKAYNRYID